MVAQFVLQNIPGDPQAHWFLGSGIDFINLGLISWLAVEFSEYLVLRPLPQPAKLLPGTSFGRKLFADTQAMTQGAASIVLGIVLFGCIARVIDWRFEDGELRKVLHAEELIVTIGGIIGAAVRAKLTLGRL